MSTKAEALQVVLPALQHMARFRGANREVVCRQRGIRTADLEAVVASVFGSWARVDEENLEEIASGLGVPVPAYEPAKPGYIGAVIEAARAPVRMGRPPKESSVERRVTSKQKARKPVHGVRSTVDRKQEEAKPAAPELMAEADPWIGHALQLRKARTYLAILTAIAVRGWEKVRPVLPSEFGVNDPAFRVWKLKYFGPGELVGPKFDRFHAWLRAQAGVAAAEKPVGSSPSTVDSRTATEPRSPANTAAGQVLDLLADFEDWTEVGREPDVVVSGGVLTLSAPLLALLMEGEQGLRLLQGKHARVFVAPDRQKLAVAFGVDGIRVTMAETTASLPLRGWSGLIPELLTEWRVAEIPATGVVHLVFERSGEGRAA